MSEDYDTLKAQYDKMVVIEHSGFYIKLKEQISELQRQNKNFECCGNCKFDLTVECPKKDEFTIGNKVCPKWQSDNMTADRRMV